MKKTMTFYSCYTLDGIKKDLSGYVCSHKILSACGDKKFRGKAGCRKLRITIEEVGK